MTGWKVVRGSQETAPSELDMSSSPTTVYQRRNIEQIEVEQTDSDETVSMWQYEEREMTPAEYSQMQITQESTDAILAFNRQAVLDEFTAELIEGGVL